MRILSMSLAVLALSSLLAISASGCHFEGGFGCDDDLDLQNPGEICELVCERVAECQGLSNAEEGDCRASCLDRIDSDYAKDGAKCVIESDCSVIEDDGCFGAPIPPGGGGSGGSGSGGASSSSSSSGGGPGACTVNHDCADGEDCVEGACLARCDESCECAEGESCVEGYCEGDVPPPQTCEASCDCPEGMACVDGVCE